MARLETAIQSYNSKISDARAEAQKDLIAACRRTLDLLNERGYRGRVWLGPIPYGGLKEKGWYASSYCFDKGMLWGTFPAKRRLLGFIPREETREVRPEEIPFEEYGPGSLDYFAREIAKAESSMYSLR